MSELSVVAVLMVREGTDQELRGVLAALVPPSLKDHGNLRYELYADQSEPRRFVIVQRWTDETAYVKHDQQSDHIRHFTKSHGEKIEKVDVYRLERIG
ncbi:MAG: antibiotic biosynthesis monooxygenase [Gammaproteobacteria bacterium]|nr:antibiotic biosynthesis monooxygenase [Gammaproteobacteria bacterium]